jgi:hypothetical protein
MAPRGWLSVMGVEFGHLGRRQPLFNDHYIFATYIATRRLIGFSDEASIPGAA